MEKEDVNEPPLHNPPVDGMKITVTSQESDGNIEGIKNTDVCHKSNGVAEPESNAAAVSELKPDNNLENVNTGDNISMAGKIEAELVEVVQPNSETVEISTQLIDVLPEKSEPSNVESEQEVAIEGNVQDTQNMEESMGSIDLKVEESVTEIENECTIDTVTFQTEIVIESNDNEIIETVCDEVRTEEPSTNNILSELGESIEFSEALRSSDLTDNIENNNCAVKQELFNKEELLDILQGNDEQEGNSLHTDYQSLILRGKKILETKIALQQLTNLKKQPKKRTDRLFKREIKSSKTSTPEVKNTPKISKSKSDKTVTEMSKPEAKARKTNTAVVKHQPEIVKSKSPEIVKSKSPEVAKSKTPEVVKSKSPEVAKSKTPEVVKSKLDKTVTEINNDVSVVKNIVKDWDDDEEREEKCSEVLEESDNLSSVVIVNEEDLIKVEEDSSRTSEHSNPPENTPSSSNKSGDESGAQPQRRFGRVIKKKVIFDPDNPDTFTKTKAVKNKDIGQEKESTPTKKIKPDSEQGSKSKSPIAKLQWKKPCMKNNKQNKRLTEVDKLLMDEGAVNMIYQLTPEAPKGKKNMKTKAEFIKKIQSSSKPDTKEMKFRERKKDCKYDESEPRKILGGKQRPSLNSSVKSPSVSEDFEAHSADDSIIYRRHSSSSYSSSCMSPRRLSDVEITGQITRNNQQTVDVPNQDGNGENNYRAALDNSSFMVDSPEVSAAETINKDDCLSIKQKLNSKLNLALNKRKRENSKIDKPVKQKKIMKASEKSRSIDNFKHLSIKIEEKLAVVCVQKPGSISNLEIIEELESALKLIDSNKDISVTLLMPECGVTYSDLDLSSVLDADLEIRTSNAYQLAESIRSLLTTVADHSKLLCTGVNSRCTGVALALVALSDLTLASERASFSIAVKSQGPGPVEPGVSALTAYRDLPQPLLNDLVVFGRRVSAAEALRNGLVGRVLWPERFNEQVLTIAADIAAQPSHNIWLKKQMLSLKNRSSNTFQNCLEKERDIFMEYWISEEGQELLRTIHHIDTGII